jgi:hypothetical protein
LVQKANLVLHSRCFHASFYCDIISSLRSEIYSNKCEWVSPNCTQSKFEPSLKFCAEHLVKYQRHLRQFQQQQVAKNITTSVHTPLASYQDVLLAFLTRPAHQIPANMVPVLDGFNDSSDSGCCLVFGDTEFGVEQKNVKEFACLAHPSGKMIHQSIPQATSSLDFRQAIFDDMKDFLTPSNLFIEFSTFKLDLHIIQKFLLDGIPQDEVFSMIPLSLTNSIPVCHFITRSLRPLLEFPKFNLETISHSSFLSTTWRGCIMMR